MSAPPRRVVLTVAAVVVCAVALAAWWSFRPGGGDGSADRIPRASSPFLNTGPDARYVGSAACIECHGREHRTYHRTGMSRSSAPIDPDVEPPDGAFDHARSGVRLEAMRVDGALRHRERLRADGKPGPVIGDFPVKHVIGSGRHARTYLVEIDGFLCESPLTWFAARQRWSMSPGYDLPVHAEFSRPIGEHCLFCHVGRSEVVDGSAHRHRILEPAIGCERCHGPGSLHVALRETPGTTPTQADAADFTIVNPARLPRELGEAVCQQCHLAGDLTILTRGRGFADYRPGLPLSDFILVHHLLDEAEGMTVVGHVEQLHQSKCYQKSETLTCTTCHDPHDFPGPSRRVAFYRAVCLGCHDEAACTVPAATRERQSPENSCVRCHMPTGSTDIPHLAFSHHRIGIHSGQPPAPRRLPVVDPHGKREGLAPFHDLAHWSAAERKRALGVAYAQAGAHRDVAELVEPYNQRARVLLLEAWEAGLRDGDVASSLAAVLYRLKLENVRPYVDAALQDERLAGEHRASMLFLAGDDEFKQRNFAAAAEFFRATTKLRRAAADWSYLSKCERLLGRRAEGLKALETAVEIAPLQARLRRELIDEYLRSHDAERAEWHRERLPGGPAK